MPAPSQETEFVRRRVGWVRSGATEGDEGYPRPGLELARIRRVIDLDDREVLEIGCGDGRLTLQYGPRARRVVALDPNQDDVARARSEGERRRLDHVRFVARSAQDGFGGLGSFDVALFSWSL